MDGTTGATVTGTPNDYEGFTYDHADPTTASTTIAGDGTTVIKLYYTRNVNTAYKVKHYQQNLAGDGYDLVDTEDLEGKTGATVDVTPKNYDGFTPEDRNPSTVTILANGKAVASLYYSRNTDTPYKVEHYQQNVTGSDFTLVDTDELNGTTGATVGITPKTYTGFVEDENNLKEVTIAADGSAVVKLYYNRTTADVTFDTQGGSAIDPVKDVRYEATITEPAAPTKTGYVFDGWYLDAEGKTAFDFSTPITAATTIYVKWAAATDTKYVVEHYQQNVTGSEYTLVSADTENLTGTTDETAAFTSKTYTGFTFDHAEPADATIAPDGSTVVKLYYNRTTADVTFDTQGGSIVAPQTGVRYGANITVPKAPTKTGYGFEGWYLDAEGKTAFDFSTPITATTKLFAKWTKDPDPKYDADLGDDDTRIEGTDKDAEISIFSDKADQNPMNHFMGVEIDGVKLVRDTDYIVTEDGKIRVLGVALKRLPVGEHTLSVVFDNGRADTKLKILEEEFEYNGIEGLDGIWVKDSGVDHEIVVKRSVNDPSCYSHFTELKFDGVTLVRGRDYEARSGSTIITFKAAFLQKNELGKHKVSIVFDDGLVETTLTIVKPSPEKPPKMGDDRTNFPWFILMLISLIGFVSVIYWDKKRKGVRRAKRV